MAQEITHDDHVGVEGDDAPPQVEQSGAARIKRPPFAAKAPYYPMAADDAPEDIELTVGKLVVRQRVHGFVQILGEAFGHRKTDVNAA